MAKVKIENLPVEAEKIVVNAGDFIIIGGEEIFVVSYRGGSYLTLTNLNDGEFIKLKLENEGEPIYFNQIMNRYSETDVCYVPNHEAEITFTIKGAD